MTFANQFSPWEVQGRCFPIVSCKRRGREEEKRKISKTPRDHVSNEASDFILHSTCLHYEDFMPWCTDGFKMGLERCTEGVATNTQTRPPAEWVTPAWLKEANTLHKEEDDVQG